MSKKILTLDDLYDFYASKGRSAHFNAKDDGDQIVVRVTGNIQFEQEDKNTEGLTRVTIKACHDGKNLNKTAISKEVMEAALPSFANRPILAYIYTDDDGNPQFRDHAMHVDEDGNLIYDEKPVGIVPESFNGHLEYDEEKEKYYTVVDGYIFDDYSNAKEILERDDETSVSVELSIRSLSFNAKDKIMNLEDYYYTGVTCLGYREDNGAPVEPAMVGANIRISDFKQRNSARFSQENVIAMLNEITEKIDQLTINHQCGKEVTGQMTKFEELLEKYNKSAEDISFEYAELDDEALEAAFAEAFGDAPAAEPVEESVQPEEPEEKYTKVFELSHNDIRCGLYALLSQYEQEDNEWYAIISVYDDHFVYQGIFDASNLYDQKYSKNGDDIAFEGERVHMNAEYITDEELAALNEMRRNYAKFEEMSARLAKYEAEPEKIALLESEGYDGIKSTEEYQALAKREAYFELDKEDLERQLNEILLNYAKQNRLDFSVKTHEDTKPVLGMVPLVPMSESKKRNYGSLLSSK